jgi:hypothetical protein
MINLITATLIKSATAHVNLSGTSAAPHTDNDFGVGTPADAGWKFNSTGDLTKYTYPTGAHDKPEWYGYLADTTHTTPVPVTYYVRATWDDKGGLDEAPTGSGSDSLGVWLSMGASRYWYWTAATGFNISRGQVKVEIATDSGGTNIIATGYYRGNAETEL